MIKQPSIAQINDGLICPYCYSGTEYVDSSIVYGKSYGMIFICKPCEAWVGVHKGTNQSLGRLANSELREAKKQAHQYFDQIARTNLINKIWKKFIPNVSNRKKAYMWLSTQTGIREKWCHIGMMDVEQCQKVIEVCQGAMNNLKGI
jgi:hypothetical protein